MKKVHSPSPKHFLICTNHKEVGSCCGAKGSQALLDNLRNRSKKEGWRRHVRVVGSSCLGHCERGITCRLEPDGVLFMEVRVEDEAALLEFLKEQLPQKEKA